MLLADHELNVSTFAVRVTASSGAGLAACVLSGLCALTGPRHGRAGTALGELIARMKGVDDAEMLRSYVQRVGSVPGFGHPLYAGIDVRAAALLDHLEAPEPHARLRDIVEQVFQLPPNIDYPLSAMTARFGLPAEAPFHLFTVARSAGWIAHAIEQSRDGSLIRPRARYIGALPA